MISIQRSISSMSPAKNTAVARECAIRKSSTGSPTRSARTKASAVQVNCCSSMDGTSSGNKTLLTTRAMVASSPDDCGDHQRLIGQSLPPFESTPVGEF